MRGIPPARLNRWTWGGSPGPSFCHLTEYGSSEFHYSRWSPVLNSGDGRGIVILVRVGFGCVHAPPLWRNDMHDEPETRWGRIVDGTACKHTYCRVISISDLVDDCCRAGRMCNGTKRLTRVSIDS